MSSEAFLRNDMSVGTGLTNSEISTAAASVAVAGAAAVIKARNKWNGWVKASLIALSALSGASAATITAVSAFVGYKVVKPARRVLTEEIAEEFNKPLLPREKISFKSADGRLSLCGYFYPSNESQAAIILCHGFHGGAVDTHRPALFAQAHGYNALTLDFRGCGESEGNTTSVGFWEVEDLLGAIEYLKSRPEVDPERIAVYGYSMGGAVAIMAAARSTDIKAIVTDAAFASLDSLLKVKFGYFYRLPHFPFRHTAVWWSRRFSNTSGKRVDPVESLKKMASEGRNLPHFILHGAKDPGIPVEDARVLYEHTPGPKHLWIEPEAEHVVGGYVDPHYYMARLCEFLDPIMKA
ncbi:MAG TPA: alpha/beta fold hydrolase [Chloroflexia bacterium]|nr:alpha/beta fold hydrolase [Chloroflexia bacterium]